MTGRLVAILALLSAGLAGAQEAAEAPGGRVRVLDRLKSEITDLDLSKGQSQTVGRLTVGLLECRYPVENPAAESWMHLVITDAATSGAVFSGWMLSSSPALSALDNPRYDVWVLGCVLPDGALSAPDEATSDAEG